MDVDVITIHLPKQAALDEVNEKTVSDALACGAIEVEHHQMCEGWIKETKYLLKKPTCSKFYTIYTC